MLKVLGRRVLISVPLLLVVSFLVFLLINIGPGDAAERAAGPSASPELVRDIRHNMGLDTPLLSRYGHWITKAVRGDFGKSLFSGERVSDMFGQRLPITASVAGLALLIALVIGTVFGLLASLRPGGIVDRAVSVGCAIAVATPSFWIGLLLVTFFAVNRPWFPATGYVPTSEGVFEWLKGLTLPALALAGLPAAELARQLRGSIIETMESDYVLAAQARGIRRRSLVLKHALKNAAIPPVTVLGIRIAQMLGGTVVVERLFAIPGLGSLSVESVLNRDFTVVQAIVVLSTVTVVVVNLAVDTSYAYFNPKLRTR